MSEISILDKAHPDLVAFWDMNRQNDTLLDERGNFNGQISGATTGDGLLGPSLVFDGNNDYALINPAPELSQFAFSTFMTLHELQETKFIIALRNNQTTQQDWQLTQAANYRSGRLCFAAWNHAGAAFEDDISPGVPDTEPHHVIFQVKADAIETFYDGVLSSVVPYSGTIAGRPNVMSMAAWVRGTTKSFYSSCTLQRTRFFSRPVTPQEAKELASEASRYELKGQVRVNNVPFAGKVRLYRADTGELAQIMTADSNGEYQQQFAAQQEYYLMAIPPDGYQPVVHGPVKPALRDI